ncbi:MAG TPA: TRAP transporter small permease subunit [Polyangiaceae bacterium]|jgi:TRAP-type C4-dicarboxylate transport system permease small subunit
MADDQPEKTKPPRGDDAPLQRLDAAWQRLEARLCAGVLVAEIASLTLWVSLKGLSADYMPGATSAGLVYRAILTATVLGVAAHLATRKQAPRVHAIATTIAVVVGLFAGRLWAHAGVVWSANLLNWLQNASSLMLIGGLRGLATRFTLWVALLGASLATSRGKHIHVDVLIRYVPVKLRRPTAIVGQLAALLVCVFGAVGFCDYIAISVYRADAVKPCPGEPMKSCDTSPGEKLATVEQKVSADFFLLGRQASLDVKSVGKVLGGTPYDKWMTASEWNAWLDGSDWTSHFEKRAVDAIRMDPSQPDATRMPQVPVPGTGEEARGLLIRELDFVFPFGLLVIALKFLLRILLILQGKIDVDPEAAHKEEELANAEDRDEAASGAAGATAATAEGAAQ